MNEFEIYKFWCEKNNRKITDAESLKDYFATRDYSQKEVITVKDLQKILGDVSYDTACRIMREVKSCSDTLKIRGIIHRFDWNKWLEMRGTYGK